METLAHLRIPQSKISFIAGGTIVSGGFGEVRQGTYRKSWFSSPQKVAVKILRPAGDENQRLRIAAVRYVRYSIDGSLDTESV